MGELTAVAQVYVIAVDQPENSRQVKATIRIQVPVLLDNDLAVTRQYDMHARPGLPMGGMKGVPAMGFVAIDGKGVVLRQRSNLYFGADLDLMLRTVRGV